MKLGEAACHLGIGLVAGLVGTAAITVSQLIEMRIRGRNASKTPAKAAEKVFGFQPVDEQSETRIATLIHWGYGTSWGTFRSVLGVAGVHGPLASLLHTGAIQGTAMVMLPGLQVAPPVKEWGAKEIGVEVLHHLVYGLAAGATYDWLCQSAFPKQSRRLGWNVLLGGLTAVGVQRLGSTLRMVRPSPARLEHTRRLASEVWNRDWPHARRELEALRR